MDSAQVFWVAIVAIGVDSGVKEKSTLNIVGLVFDVTWPSEQTVLHSISQFPYLN